MSAFLHAARARVTPAVTPFADRNRRDRHGAALDRAIVRAVTYASLFQFPLTPDELCRSLVGHPATPERLVARFRASHWLQTRLGFVDGHFLPARHDAWLRVRRNRETRSRAILESHRRYLIAASALPWVRMVAISGSLAHLNADAQADLDLFVVARRGRVWITTLSLVLLAKLLRRRRTVCANYVVSDDDLAASPADEFTANQIIHLRPVVGEAVYRRFLAANAFVETIYPNFSASAAGAPLCAPFPTSAAWVQRLTERLLWPLGALLERASRAAYGAYLRRRLRTWPSPEQVRLSASQVKLHGHSHRREVRARFTDAVREVDDDPGASNGAQAPVSRRCFAR